ncbi:alpha/beta hydrolase [Povalibacter sp.]|uniref:alpha/beta hydrolase n=1 Tax=Povalibacter sp. TaxID=1962978 RepID=UPI002F400E7E
MTLNTPRPLIETLRIPGPAGELEAILETPPDTVAENVIVICHPHPLYGGTMTNKVVHMLAKACNELGVPSVRFNYRGVGRSAGAYAEGNGETDDAVAVLDWAHERWPDAGLWLGGFSFGGAVAIRAAVRREVRRLITVAPAIRRVAVDDGNLPQCPWLVVQGDQDELVDSADIQRWVASLSTPPELVMLEGVQHFFHGRMNDLRQVVLDWARRTA